VADEVGPVGEAKHWGRGDTGRGRLVRRRPGEEGAPRVLGTRGAATLWIISRQGEFLRP
jgi:hypothetical protein